MDPLFSFLFGLAVAALFFTAGGFLWWISEHTKRLAVEAELSKIEAKLDSIDRMRALAEKDNLALIQKLQQQGHYIAHLRMMLNASGGISIQGPCHIEGSDEDEEISGLN